MRKPNTICAICGKEIYRKPCLLAKENTCSKECRSKLNLVKNRVVLKCLNCSNEFSVKKSFIPQRPFCNKKCKEEYLKFIKNKVIELHEYGMYDKDIAKSIGYSRVYVTRIIKDKFNKNRKIKINNKELRQRLSKANKGKRTGEENHKFKGNSKYVDIARGLFNSISKQYMLKMNYTCKKCGKRGGELNTHHIKHFSLILKEFLSINKNIKLRDFSEQILKYRDFIDENNLILLCRECHDKEHYNIDNK